MVATLCDAAVGIEVIEAAHLTEEERERFGITEFTGAVVANIFPGSLARAGGLEIGDVIQGVNNTPVRDTVDFILCTFGKSQRDILNLSGRRRGRPFTAQVELIARNF